MSALLDELRSRMAEVIDLRMALALLHWDQEVCMPPKGAIARAHQIATLSALAHRQFTCDAMRRMVDQLAAQTDLHGDDAIMLREIRHDLERAVKLPPEFVAELAETTSRAYEVWREARARSDFKAFAPSLDKIIALQRRKADFLGYAESPYDALLDEYERGMTAARIRPLFAALARAQQALVARIAAAPQPDCAWLDQAWDVERQWHFTLRVLADIGYDFEAGRQDRSVHPFTTNFDLADVRVTTRLNPNELFSALTGSLHEGGHALYEQGFREADRRTILAEAVSLGIHESQSRLWENLVGRSLPFWQHYLPRLREEFPGQLDTVTPEMVHAAINRVAPSLIRVEADECTYNLHVILRFEMEVDLIEGRLRTEEIPECWNAKVKDYLGLEVPDDAHGCLQDIHWSHGSFGYFPTYALGNLYAAQLFAAAQRDLPALGGDIAAGRFQPLLRWLRVRVHQHGRRKRAHEILEDATGKAPDAEDYIAYLTRKYTALYGLD